MRFSGSRSDYSVARKTVVQLSSRQQRRRIIQCSVFLEDDAIADSATVRSRSENADGDGSYASAMSDPLMSTALTDAQLRAAITDICGPSGFRTTDGNEDEQEEIEDASLSYSDIWTSSTPDEEVFSREGTAGFNDTRVSDHAGRADVRALQAMETRLEKSKLSEVEIADSGALLAVPSEDAEEMPQASLLPEIQQPGKCNEHRVCGFTLSVDFLQEISESTKFLDRWTIFSRQLRVWGYYDHKVPTLKRTLNSFARSNPDLLYMLPARELHIFVKKFRAFPSRSLDRKFRAAAARLANVYVDFQIQATFNGNACFQDVTRLLMFVATSEFSEIERTAPGIVAAASDLLVVVLIAATQPPSELAREDHSAQWRDMRDSVAENVARNPSRSKKRRQQRKQKRSSELHDEEAELAAERRLESMEEKLAASLRKGTSSHGSSRPWTPWDAISSESSYGSNSTSKAGRRKQHDHSSDRSAREAVSEDRPRGRYNNAEVDAWGAPDSARKRVPRGAGDARASSRASHTPAQEQQRHKRGSKSLVDFMSMVGDSAGGSKEHSHSKKRSEKPPGGGYGQKASGYSGGVGML